MRALTFACLVVVALVSGMVTAIARVDMSNANYIVEFIDIRGSGEFQIARTYNSRSLVNGLFGFGWCSDLEDRLEQRDPDTLALVNCGGGRVDLFRRVTSSAARAPQIPAQQFELFAGRGNEVVQRYADRAIHVSRAMTTVSNVEREQKRTYDTWGRLVAVAWDDVVHLRIERRLGAIIGLVDRDGARWTVTTDLNQRITAIIGSGGRSARYRYKADDLTMVRNQWTNIYVYEYNDGHNMTKISWPDRTYVALTYDDQRDWVTSFRDRDGCMETYDYRFSKQAPDDHYMSSVVKTCNDVEVGRLVYEFIYTPPPVRSLRIQRQYTLIDAKTNRWRRDESVYDRGGNITEQNRSLTNLDVQRLLD